MRRIKLVVSYDGTAYCGWQLQPNGVTIEEVLNQALSSLLKEDIQVIGASRTDSGVHAMGNVAVFDTESRIPGDKICFALNQRLPDDVRIQASEEVPLTFHPRKVNCVKTYEYKILNRKIDMPLQRLYSYFCYFNLDLEKMQPQYGDENIVPFSFAHTAEDIAKPQVLCWLTYTNEETHRIIRENIHRAPMYAGTIHGTGARYCPSIEDKLRTFADKEQHQLFLEPEGDNTNEYYLNGFSSSLPWEVQYEALHRIRGLEDVHIFRPGYAIEYDYFPPTQLRHTLETKLVDGLYFAGQVNGTTGYEEAAAQGLLAGINAHRKRVGESTIVLQRDEAYIGVLIDDLVTKGVDEPYRMFTSRAEYRILLRQDNADLRLTPLGHEIGLISEKDFANFERKKSCVESLISFARRTSVRAGEIDDYLKSVDSEPMKQGRKLYDILLRNEITFAGLSRVLPKLAQLIEEKGMTTEAIEEAEIQIKYNGYIQREKFIAEKLHRLENIAIPADFDYHSMQSLTIEARQKLTRIRPTPIGQASRIPGVSPADVNVLLVKFGR